MHLHMAKIKHVKYFIGYETDNKIIILFNNVPQVSGCFNAFKKFTK